MIFNRLVRKKVVAEVSVLRPNHHLEGKKVILTGGGRGLGASMAEKFVSEGAAVLISGRDEKVLKQTSDKLGCAYLVLDVTKTDTFGDFLKNADEMLGGVDCLVNNAGVSLHEPDFFSVTPDTFNKQIDTNFRGPFFLTQLFVKMLIDNKRKGNVLFISSETGEMADFRPYGFTKAAVNSMVRGLAYLFVKDGIRVNAVAPGVTASEMTGFTPGGNLYYSGNPAERVYLPEEVAETACFLLSDASQCISGQIITCNNAGSVNARWK